MTIKHKIQKITIGMEKTSVFTCTKWMSIVLSRSHKSESWPIWSCAVYVITTDSSSCSLVTVVAFSEQASIGCTWMLSYCVWNCWRNVFCKESGFRDFVAKTSTMNAKWLLKLVELQLMMLARLEKYPRCCWWPKWVCGRCRRDNGHWPRSSRTIPLGIWKRMCG